MNIYKNRSRKGPLIATVLGATALISGGILAWGYAPEAIADTDFGIFRAEPEAEIVKTLAYSGSVSDSISAETVLMEKSDIKLQIADYVGEPEEVTPAPEEELIETTDEVSEEEYSEEYVVSEESPEEYEASEEYEEVSDEAELYEEVIEEEPQETTQDNGEFSYSEAFTCTAYAYVAGGYGASGNPAVVGTVAVDPSIIPLGTRLYIEGYGYAVANDTGGNIIGYTLDLVMDTEAECYQWGVRTVTVYVLD